MLAWAYSAPPIRLKQNGWWGNAACGLCYEGLPWFTGAAVMSASAPDWRIVVIALLYSVGAHGIMTLNDFKSVEGDKRMGIDSLPVLLGVGNAARFACLVMAVPQVAVVGLLLAWQRPFYAAAVGALLIAQFFLMAHFLKSPRERAPWYNGTGISCYVVGMLISAFALAAMQGGLSMNNPVLSWFGIVRLGLVQTGLGAIVVLTTSTLNRVMVVELAMPAILPGALVAIHYALQVFRPAWGHGSDLGARRTPWIVGGMAVLATGGLLASVATAWMTTHPLFGIALAVVAFCLIGVGRRRRRHVAAGAARQAHRRQPPRGGGDHRLGDDDRRLHRDDRRGRSSARSVLAAAADRRFRVGIRRGDVSHAGWRVGHRRKVGSRRFNRDCRSRRASLRSAKPSWKSGPNRSRGGLRSSSSSRCWPTARRI